MVFVVVDWLLAVFVVVSDPLWYDTSLFGDIKYPKENAWLIKTNKQKKEFSFWKSIFRIVPNICGTSGAIQFLLFLVAGC